MASSSVFVGNLPQDAKEEFFADLFKVAGEVERFRVMMDTTTGNSKGYGFCDFKTVEAAQIAIKNLNGYEVAGKTLSVKPAAPPGTNTDRTAKQAKDIDTALKDLSVGEVYDILVEVKNWIKEDPDKVRDVLLQKPILAQALLKMQTSMGMLQTPPQADVSFASLTPQPYVVAPQQNAAYGSSSNPSSSNNNPSNRFNPTAPQDSQQLLKQILSLSDAEVASLAPEQRVHVEQIRSQVRRNAF